MAASTSEDDKDLLEMLWQEGPAPGPLLELPDDRSTARCEEGAAAAAAAATRANNQVLMMGEDELRLLLVGGDEDGGGSGNNIYSDQLLDRPPTGNSSSTPMPVLEKGKELIESAYCSKQKARDQDDDDEEEDEDAHTMDVETGNIGEKERKESEQQQEAASSRRRRRGSRRRTRAVEMHNLSERRRRNRINEKMKVLQELIPRCNKSDKASMLDDAIEYMKILKLQVQMMMGPCMLLDSHRYLATMGFPAMGMGMGMNMGMASGVDIGYAPIIGHHLPPPPPPPLPPPPLPTSLVPSFPSSNIAYANMVQIPNLADPHRWYVGAQYPHVSAQEAYSGSSSRIPTSSQPAMPEKFL